jgi:endoglucanase
VSRQRRRAPVRSLVLAATCGAVVAGSVVGCSSSTPEAPGSGTADDGGRLGQLWLNPEGHAAVAARQAAEQGRSAEAEALAPLADQPTATWFANPGDPYPAVEQVSVAADAAGRTPVLVAYHVPDRDCRSYSSGGAADADSYLAWIGSFAAALGDRPAVVVLEPDAVAQTVVGCEGVQPADRYQLLAQAVDVLEKQPRVTTYLDAGNSDWVTDLPVLAAALRSSGIDNADGFAVNVSNFQTTDDSAAFGLALSRELEHGQPDGASAATFVIDTSRNGAGAPPDDGTGTTAWCNPAGRRLGEAPTTDTGRERVDALLWVKQPGDSDGTCAGGPPAGQWWPEGAAALVGG